MALDRRQDDPRIAKLVDDVLHLHTCTERVHASLARMEDTVATMSDILASFRVLGKIAGWVTSISVAITTVWAALKVAGR